MLKQPWIKCVVTGCLVLSGLFAQTLLAALPQKIESVRLHRAPDHTRIVFDLDQSLEYSLNKLANPDRVVIDLDDAELDFDMDRLELAQSPITAIRVGAHENNRTRIVFDLHESVRPATQILKPIAPHGWRLVVDLHDKQTTVVKQAVPDSPSQARTMVVAIDAGHGGEDPGAIGPKGTREKKVVLQIAKRLYELMKNEPGIKPVLIRTGDYYVPLVDRRRNARAKHGADVFISIHADAFTNPKAHGASVFALSTKGATSARARYLAEIENESDKVAGVFQAEADNDVLDVLADLTMTGTLNHSLKMGSFVLTEMGKVTKLHGNRDKVEQAGFAVLKEPQMVSILVETGFISNHNEEKNLTSRTHQQKLAKAIMTGVKNYFENYPAPGSYFYAKRQGVGTVLANSYRIEAGDTLSAIAAMHEVAVADLRRANRLSSDQIRVGQVLKIPR